MAFLIDYCGCGGVSCHSKEQGVVGVTRFYYWISARDETGKSYLIFGSDKTEDEARQKGLDMLGSVDFEIKRLPTRNLASASSMIRGKRLKETHSLRQAGKRIGHTKSIERLRRRVSGNW